MTDHQQLRSRGTRFWIALGAIMLSAAYVRTVPVLDQVFTEDGIRFQGVDAYYHVRLTRFATEHFPVRLRHDPLRLHPEGQRVDVYPAFDFLNALCAQVAGGFSPTHGTADLVAAWSPPILGCLTVLLMGLAGSNVAGRWGGLASATVTAFLPGGTVSQTMLGYADHHAMELFLLAGVWFLLSIDDHAAQKPPWTTAMLLGVLSGLYMLTWEGSPVLPAVLFLFLILQRAVRPMGPLSSVHSAAWAVTALVAALTVLVFRFDSSMVQFSLALFAAIPAALFLYDLLEHRIVPDRKKTALVMWAALVVGAGVILWTFVPEHVRSTFKTNVGRLFPSDVARTVNEMRPMADDPSLVWSFFGASLLWALVGATVGWRSGRWSRWTLLGAAVSIVFVPAALMQVRFAGGAALGIALLNASAIGAVTASPRPGQKGLATRTWVRGVAAALWIVSVPLWSLRSVSRTVTIDRGPLSDWVEAASWLRENTHDPSLTGEPYGILNWWDSGYYLTTIAQRAPVTNPTQAGARTAATWYLDTTGAAGVELIAAKGVRYIIVDATVSIIPTSVAGIEGKLPALMVWAGVDRSDFFRTVWFPMPDGSLQPRIAYLPAYFRSLQVRLMLYGGDGAVPRPGSIWAVRTSRREVTPGRHEEVVESALTFASSAAAEEHLKRQRTLGWMLVSFSPFETCITLPELGTAREVYRSPTVAFAAPSLPSPVPVLRVFAVYPTSAER